MNIFTQRKIRLSAGPALRFLPAFVLAGVLLPACLMAYPPAPPHTVFGTVRDEYGNPLRRTDARVLFEANNGTRFETRISPGLPDGVNYEILVPMDAGVTSDLYRPTAMRPTAPFQMKVIMGNRTYLPIEMSGNFKSLGKPAEASRLNLTLGLDSDGDGLPDAWKDMVIAMMGGGLTRADIRPHDDLDGDGMTNLQEYIAGTYAWDSEDSLELEILDILGGYARLGFLAIDGRTYHIEGSPDMNTWQPVPFRLIAGDASGNLVSQYLATSVRPREVEVEMTESELVAFRLIVR